MTAAEVDRAFTLGAELDRIVAFRNRRARLMLTPYWAGMPAGARCRYIMELAELDKRRRSLRGLLDDAMTILAGLPAYRRTGRHARPYVHGDERDHPEGSEEYWRAMHARMKAEGKFDDLA
jgi:hypothetical protein